MAGEMSHLGDKLNLIICFTVLTWGISSCVWDTNETKKESKNHPNIIFITTDYQRGVDGPSLGSPFLEMPALDRLCKEGMVFTRHYSTAPICMPARYTWLTGRYPHYHGAWDNTENWIPEKTPVLMELLKAAGYNTIGVGKMHVSPWNRDIGFDKWISADNKRNGKRDAVIDDDYSKFLDQHGMSRWNYLKLQSESEIFGVYDWPYDEKFHIDHYVGDQATGIIKKNEFKEPFFMWISFNGPHNPWDPPAGYSEPYKEMKLPLGNTFPGELATKPKDHTRLRNNYTPQVPGLIDANPERRDEIIHQIRAGHYGGLTFIDRQLEKVFTALEDKGLFDETIIIYSSDHGAGLGDHNLIHKGTHYNSSAKVPFVVRYPKKIKHRQTDAFSSHVDLMPTLLELAGVPIPESLEGNSLVPILTGKEESVQDKVFIEIRGTTSIVTDDWKMGINPKDQDGDLYDLKNDPNEIYNLFGKQEYAEIQAKLVDEIVKFNPDLAEVLAGVDWLKKPMVQ
jgi:arylsulfatase